MLCMLYYVCRVVQAHGTHTQQYSRTSSSIITHFPFQTCTPDAVRNEKKRRRRRRMGEEDGMRCASHKLAGPVHLFTVSHLLHLFSFASFLLVLSSRSTHPVLHKNSKKILQTAVRRVKLAKRRISRDIFIRCVASRRWGGGGGSGITSQLSKGIHTNRRNTPYGAGACC